MEFLDTLRGALRYLRGGEVEAWAESEENFEEHFGRSYEEFVEILLHLDQAHSQLYESTKTVNPEAAVTWVFFISEME